MVVVEVVVVPDVVMIILTLTAFKAGDIDDFGEDGDGANKTVTEMMIIVIINTE